VKRVVTAGLAGGLFGVGLAISAMTEPRNVIGFLDLFGHFNPSLAAVMVGAIGVHATVLFFLRRRGDVGAGTAASDATSASRNIDRDLVVGAALFGVGWGLAGYCPGPAIVSLGFLTARPVAFVAAVLVGMVAADAFRRARAPRSTGDYFALSER